MISPEDTISNWREFVDHCRLIVRPCVRSTNAQKPGLPGTFWELIELKFGGIYCVHCYSYSLEATISRTYVFWDV